MRARNGRRRYKLLQKSACTSVIVYANKRITDGRASKELGSGSNDYRFDTLTKLFGDDGPSIGGGRYKLLHNFRVGHNDRNSN